MYQAQEQAEVQARADTYVTLELLDREVDHRHRSFLSAVLEEDLGHVRSRIRARCCRSTTFGFPST
jgi:hypothetical protein